MSAPKVTLVLARHGESEANAANVFTGKTDVPLTDRGRDEARRIGQRLVGAGLTPDRIFQSPLSRCVETVRIVNGVLGSTAIVPISEPGLGERDYGALTGLNKAAAAERFGAEQVRRWRRSYTDAPPEGENLRDTAARVLAAYVSHILPGIMHGGTTLLIAHGNSLRSLAMALDGLGETEVEKLEIPTGAMLVYELDATTAVTSRKLLT
jgi:2,3-bisphosphoglycerate-dependent phosphoglycerate mutase